MQSGRRIVKLCRMTLGSRVVRPRVNRLRKNKKNRSKAKVHRNIFRVRSAGVRTGLKSILFHVSHLHTRSCGPITVACALSFFCILLTPDLTYSMLSIILSVLRQRSLYSRPETQPARTFHYPPPITPKLPRQDAIWHRSGG